MKIQIIVPIIVLLSAFSVASQSIAQTLKVQGDNDTEVQFTLDSESVVRLLSSDGSVEARAAGEVICESESDSEPCECDCEAEVNVDQYSITAGGKTYNYDPSSVIEVTVTQGDELRFRWKVPGALEIVGEGLPNSLWNGAVREPYGPENGLAVGTSDVSPSEIPYELILTGQNNSITETAQINLIVEEQDDGGPEDSPPECDERTPLSQHSSLIRADDVLRDNDDNGYEFSSVFVNPFPGSTNTRSFRLKVGQFAAIRFETPDDLDGNHGGRLQGETLPGYFGGRKLVTISKCKGDFRRQPDDRCEMVKSGTTEAIFWSGDPDNPYGDCPLEAGTQYYLNILFTHDSFDDFPQSWHCDDDNDRCGHYMTPQHNY